MDKRYQVFVSSTYADLKDERQRVVQVLMEMDCIPSGMELFPAVDEDQWEFIKKVIDDCDYYLLIIGGRYGSTAADGIGYTEKEYDYAIEKGLKVMAFIHKSPGIIPVSRSEQNPELQKKLIAFREKVAKGRLVKFWESAEELPGIVALSVIRTIKTFPAIGWIRADQASNTELLNEVNELRKKKEELEAKLLEHKGFSDIDIPDIASLDDEVHVYGTLGGNYDKVWKVYISWGEMFSSVAPYLTEEVVEHNFKDALTNIMFEKAATYSDNFPELNDQLFQTIKIQFQVLGLMTSRKIESYSHWKLTQKGFATMVSLRVHRTAKSNTVVDEDDGLPF